MKSYSFWVSFSGALIVLLNAFGKLLGFSIENKVVEDCVMAVAGILIVIGIVTMDIPKDDGDKTDEDKHE